MQLFVWNNLNIEIFVWKSFVIKNFSIQKNSGNLLSIRYEKTSAEFVTQLPAGKHSTKGLGRTAPDPTHFKTTDSGAVIPLGEGKPTTDNRTSLLYNE